MTLTVLIADDERAARYGLAKALARLDCEVYEAEDGQAALLAIQQYRPDLVFLDLNMPVLGGEQVLRELAEQNTTAEIIVVTADDTLPSAVECMRLGATDYLTKPYELERLRAIARRNIRRIATEQQRDYLQAQLDNKTAFGALLGVSRPMQQLFGQLQRAARAPLDILIRGETGTGKELLASELHRLSNRCEGPLIALNTAAISDSLAESQLFGHRKGAFTGASADHKGVFEQAQGGTLFLDEIGDMPLALQTKILRTLQERTVQALGSVQTISIDLRIICATHQDLELSVQEGHFREDLYYRIKGIELIAPPLRQRPEDITLLADYFLTQLANNSDLPARQLSAAAVQQLLSYHWPGNVRELRQVITAAGAMAAGETIEPRDLKLTTQPTASADFDLSQFAGLPLSEAKSRLVEWFERDTITKALRQHEDNISAAARELGIHRQSLQQKMQQLGINRNN